MIFDNEDTVGRTLDEVEEVLLGTVFAVAMAMKVTPKKLAKIFDVKKLDKFALDFNEMLLEKQAKIVDKADKAVKKLFKTKGKK